MPIEASAPLTGRSMPMRIVPDVAAADDVAVAVDCDAGWEQRAAAMMLSAASDARRTAPREGLARPAPPFRFRRTDTPGGGASLYAADSRTAAALKYVACGWWMTIAAVDCSGTI